MASSKVPQAFVNISADSVKKILDLKPYCWSFNDRVNHIRNEFKVERPIAWMYVKQWERDRV